MSTVARPPVNEVVISISFEPQPILEGPRMMVGLSRILADFPEVNEAPLYEMAVEQPFEEQVLQSALPQIQFVGSSQLRRRYWFTNLEASALLLQIQHDYFALNWRSQEGGECYPGFDHLQRCFKHYLGLLQESLLGHGGEPLRISQIEVTYINILRPDGLWGSVRDVEKVIAIKFPDVSEIEQLNVAFAEPVKDDAGSFYGRLHAAVSTGYQPKAEPAELRPLSMRDLVPVINLSITARSAKIDDSIETVAQRFGTAHDVITEKFKNLTTDEARAGWGLA